MTVIEDYWTMAELEINVLISIDVPNMGTLVRPHSHIPGFGVV
jgi:hypothetical protein